MNLRTDFEAKDDQYQDAMRKMKILETEKDVLTKQRDKEIEKLNKFQNASQTMERILESQQGVNDKTGLGFGSFSERKFTFEDTEIGESSRVFNKVAPPLTGNFMPPRPDYIDPDTGERVELTSKTKLGKKVENNSAPIIEEWVSDSESEEECEIKVKPKKSCCNCGSANKKSETAKKTEQVKKNDDTKTDSWKNSKPYNNNQRS